MSELVTAPESEEKIEVDPSPVEEQKEENKKEEEQEDKSMPKEKSIRARALKGANDE